MTEQHDTRLDFMRSAPPTRAGGTPLLEPHRERQASSRNTLRRIHLVVGAAGVVAFLLTGQYMHWVHAHLQGMADGPRLIYRSSHIYLLWASLLNVCLGCYLREFSAMAARVAQRAGSIAVVAGPAFLCWSFFQETYRQDLERPLGRLAIYLALAGIVLHVVASFLSRPKHPGIPETKDKIT